MYIVASLPAMFAVRGCDGVTHAMSTRKSVLRSHASEMNS
jgi:hypothetical protein